jgi:hypothetical protein
MTSPSTFPGEGTREHVGCCDSGIGDGEGAAAFEVDLAANLPSTRGVAQKRLMESGGEVEEVRSEVVGCVKICGAVARVPPLNGVRRAEPVEYRVVDSA